MKPIHPPTIAEQFASYRANVIPATAGEIQVEECRRAFHAGAFIMLMTIIAEIDAAETEAEVSAALVKLRTECELFAARTAGEPH